MNLKVSACRNDEVGDSRTKCNARIIKTQARLSKINEFTTICVFAQLLFCFFLRGCQYWILNQKEMDMTSCLSSQTVVFFYCYFFNLNTLKKKNKVNLM